MGCINSKPELGGTKKGGVQTPRSREEYVNYSTLFSVTTGTGRLSQKIRYQSLLSLRCIGDDFVFLLS